MTRRHLSAPFVTKVVLFMLWRAGIPDRALAYLAVAYVVWRAAAILDRGWHEQRIQPPGVQAARLMTDYVYGRGFWHNDGESVTQAIERLAKPHLTTHRKGTP